jgi:hypothetical protein
VSTHVVIDSVTRSWPSLFLPFQCLSNPPSMISTMFLCRNRTGQEHDLEGYPHQFRPGFEESFVRWHTLYRKKPGHDRHDRSYLISLMGGWLPVFKTILISS